MTQVDNTLEQARAGSRAVVPEQMDRPAPRAERPLRDHVICVHAMPPARTEPPFHLRRGMTTLRLVEVDQIGNARLSCDCLHDGPHEWPLAYQRITATEMDEDSDGSAAESVDEGDVFV